MSKLWVLGLGLICPGHVSARTWEALRQADQLFFITDNLEKYAWLRELNPNFVDLMPFYGDGKNRTVTYTEMAEAVLTPLRQGKSAALLSYGHPLVFCDPSRMSIEKAQLEGFELEIQPAISSIDCLLADLRVDTANYGLQLYEGHDLLLHGIRPDPACSQIVFQVPSLGDNSGGWKPGRYRGYIRAMAEVLIESFGPDHPGVLYYGQNEPGQPPIIDTVPLSALHEAEMRSHYTLWVPPSGYRLLPFGDGSLAPVDWEMVGTGPGPGDISREVEELLALHPRRVLRVEGGFDAARLSGGFSPVAPDAEPVGACGCDVPPSGTEVQLAAAHVHAASPATGAPGRLLVFPGHPSGSGAVSWAREAHRRGLSFRIRPAVSQEGQLYCDVPLDPGLNGFQYYPQAPFPELPPSLGLLARSPETPPGARRWGAGVGWSESGDCWFLPGPQPRPLHHEHFERANFLSAVERLVAFLETTTSEQRALFRPAPSPAMWLTMQSQMATRRLHEVVTTHNLGDDWGEFLFNHPGHPGSFELLLKMRAEAALESIRGGVADQPLRDWLRETGGKA